MNKAMMVRLGAWLATLCLFVAMSMTHLAMTGCNGNGNGTNLGQSIDPGDGSDLSGDYVLRTDDCEPFVEITGFSVVQNGNQLTITVTKAEGDNYMVGDILDGTVVESNGDYVASIPELQCLAKLVMSQDEINQLVDLYNLDSEIGDLDSFCNDDSQDFFCNAIFQRS